MLHHNPRMIYKRFSPIFARRHPFIPTFCYSTNSLNQRVPVSLVQGASRGIGLEFEAGYAHCCYASQGYKSLGNANLVPSQLVINVCHLLWQQIYYQAFTSVKQLLQRDQKGHVLATCRNPDQSNGLLELKTQFSDRLNLIKLDVTVESTIEAAANTVRETYGYLNLLINTSAILSVPNLLHPETTLAKVQKSALLLSYEVNTVGPILVIKHMWPLLKVGGGIGTERDAAIIANLSARVGSIGDNHLGGWHSYRASKAALNQLTKTVSVELARKKDPIICLLLHPGTVDTDLSRPFQRNVPQDKLFTKEFSVNKLLSIIDDAKIHDNGKFFAWDGQEIPW